MILLTIWAGVTGGLAAARAPLRAIAGWPVLLLWWGCLVFRDWLRV